RHRDGVDPDQDLIVPGDWFIYLFDVQDVGASVPAAYDCPHRLRTLVGIASVCAGTAGPDSPIQFDWPFPRQGWCSPAAGPQPDHNFRRATKCDPFGIPSTSRWSGAAIIVQSPRTKVCIVMRWRTSTRPMLSSLAG